MQTGTKKQNLIIKTKIGAKKAKSYEFLAFSS